MRKRTPWRALRRATLGFAVALGFYSQPWQTSVQGEASFAPKVYPARPIRVIVPFAAGGGSDTFVRLVARVVRDQELLPVPFVIINTPGAGGVIGSRRVLSAPADGYTLLNLHDGIFTAKYSGNVPYGPEAFRAVAGTGSVGLVLAVSDRSAHGDLESLLRDGGRADSDGDRVSFAANLGAPSHFAGLLIEQAAPGVRFNFVQTGGGAKRFAALTGGHVDATVFSVSEYLQFRQGGIQALAVFESTRHAAIPDVPTALEQGVDVQWSNMQFWWFPRNTPESRVESLAGVLQSAMAHPDLQQDLRRLHIDPVVLTGSALAEEIARRETLIAAADIRPPRELPNFQMLCLASLALAASWLMGRTVWLRRRARVGSALAGGVASRPRSRASFQTSLAVVTVAYVGLLQGTSVPFVWLTFAFLAIGGWAIRAPTKGRLWTIIIMAGVLSVGMAWIFGRVFLIDLP